MADDDHGAALLETLQRLHNHCLGVRVDGARGLVQNEDRTVLQEGAGDGNALALAARELDPALTDLSIIALRKSDDELVGVRGPGGRDQFVPGGLRLRVADVFGDAGREEHRVLRHDCELTPEILQPEIAEVHAVEPDLSRRRVVEPREQVDQRALAGPGRAGDPQARAESDVEGDVMQDRTIIAVGERDVVEGDGTASALEWPRIRSLFDIQRLVEHGEGGLGPGPGPSCTAGGAALWAFSPPRHWRRRRRRNTRAITTGPGETARAIRASDQSIRAMT